MMQIPREYKVISTKQYQQVMLNILVEKGLNSYSPQKFLS